MRVASKGGKADYYGITYEKIDRQNGVVVAVPFRGKHRYAAAL